MLYSLLAQANVNQAAEYFPSIARGRQCVPCSFMFLFVVKTSKKPLDMGPDDLFDILNAGSNLYCGMNYKNLIINSDKSNESGFIDPESVPKKGHIQRNFSIH